jgi:CheY-like chemotaxis protein
MSQDVKRQILLIDDDPSLRRTLSDFLRFEGYDVMTAESGEKGLEALETHSPDLIILDMSMPGMGGIGFLKIILDDNGKPSHPVLVLTARANMAEFFANVEVDGFIAKPCDPQDFLMEVGRIMFLRSGEQTAESGMNKEDRRKLLLGEDDQEIGDRLGNWFSARGFIVDRASKGPEVLERAIVSRPDVIVMNMILEGMNGGAVADMLKVMPNTQGIPIVLHDDTGVSLPTASGNASGGGVVAAVPSSEPSEIHTVVLKILG